MIMAFAFTRGDEYLIPILIKDKNNTVITPDNATGVKVGIGSAVSSYPDGDLTYADGLWYFPLTQEISYRIPEGDADFQVKVKFADKIVNSKQTKVDVEGTIFKGVW